MEKNDIVVINLDKPRELRLTHKVLKRFCAKENVSMAKLESAVEDYVKLTSLTVMMLCADDPALTPEKCDDLLDRIPIGEIVQKTSEAIAAGFGAPDAQPAADEASENPTGTT